ncbi:aldehyde dehydrogenase family protein [Streptomyces sp. NPDC048002]|uniref:aldehyde dehydrogenase family protein n=1 Tax=Streptomyces sp. NPDC048002 TaxID=3154344 RepID=UPI0033F120AF
MLLSVPALRESVPALRAGEERTSRDTRVLRAVTGEPLATVHEVPPLVARLTVKAMRRSPELDLSERLAVLAEAGRLFAEATLGGQSPEEYCRLQALASGVPVSVARGVLERVARDGQSLGETVRRQIPAGAGATARWVRRGTILSVVAPSNHPGTHGAWLQAIAMGYRVAVRPGGRDPFTPLRLVRALLAAGLHPDWVALLPGGHATADALTEAGDLALVYGGEDTVARLRGNDRVLVRGPGRSKILVDTEADEALLDHLVAEIAGDGGVRCTNTTAVLTSGDHRLLAERLAERLAALPAHPVTDARAVLPVRPRPEAEALRAAAAAAAGPAPDLVAARLPEGALTSVGAQAVALHPAVFVLDRPDHPALGAELPFPCAWVAPWRKSDGTAPLDDSLALGLLTADADLVEEALALPGVRTVVEGPVARWWQDPYLPHDGYLGQFLNEARGHARG